MTLLLLFFLLFLVLSSLAPCLSSRIPGPMKKITGRPAKKLGDWRDLSREPEWSVFNSKDQSFDPASNKEYCDRETIRVKYSSTVSDYSKRINEKLRELRKKQTPGGTVKLDPGVYPVRHQIRLPSYTCLVGAGMRQTRIRLVDNAPVFEQSGIMRSLFTTRVTVGKLTIDGNKDGQSSTDLHGDAYGRYGLFTQLTNYLYLYNVSVKNNIGYGFDPHGRKLEWAYYLVVEGCEAKNNGLDGFTLDQTYFVSMINSRAYDNARHGTNIVTGTRYARIIGNKMKGNGFKSEVGCNMMAQNNQELGTGHIRFYGNDLENGRKAGYCLDDVTDVNIKTSRVENKDDKSYCFYFTQTKDIKVKSSTCEGHGKRVRSTKGATYKFVR